MERGFWIPIFSEIPDSSGFIPRFHNKHFLGYGFHKQKFPGFPQMGRRALEIDTFRFCFYLQRLVVDLADLLHFFLNCFLLKGD